MLIIIAKSRKVISSRLFGIIIYNKYINMFLHYFFNFVRLYSRNMSQVLLVYLLYIHIIRSYHMHHNDLSQILGKVDFCYP